MKPTPYLFFSGDCEQAFKFYEENLGGKIVSMIRVGESPSEYQGDPDWNNAIMHGTIRIGETLIMASDAPKERREKPQGFFIAISYDTPEEADRIFALLSEGGNIKMPIEKTFWAKRFGMTVDKFGIPWMVSCDEAPDKE